MRLLVLIVLLLLASPVWAAPTYGRGTRCQTTECGIAEAEVYRLAIAKANGGMCKRIAKMMHDWAAAGFPEDGMIEKRYNKIHDRYMKDMKAAARRWFYETMGEDMATVNERLEFQVEAAENMIYHAVISVILSQWLEL